MSQTIPPQHPMRHGDQGQQIWTIWTMFMWFLNNVYDQFAAKFALGTNTIPNGATSVTIVHNIGTTLYSVAITPLQAASGTVTDLWGPATYSLGGGYWVSGKTAAQFVLNIPSPAPAGGLAFDWMVKAA